MKMKVMVAILILLVTATFSLAGGSDSWYFHQDTDEMTDKTQSFATIDDEKGKGRIVVRCMEDSLDVLYISVGQYFSEEFLTLRVRVDKEPAESVGGWGNSSKVVFIRDSEVDSIIRTLKRGNKFLVQAYGYSENSPTTRSFSLKGASLAIQKVQEACGRF